PKKKNSKTDIFEVYFVMLTLNDLIHPSRIKILKILMSSPSTLTEITKILDFSKPEVSRHLARMRESGLVTKNDKNHEISNLGEIVLGNISSLEFLVTHHVYFKDHQIIDLPQMITRHLDSLEGSQLIVGMGFILKEIEGLNNIPVDEVKIMIDQPFPAVRELKVNKSSFIIPAKAKDENIDLEAIESTSASYEIRTLPAINVSFGIFDDKYGYIFFPDLTGRMDYNSGFFISDVLGIEFLSSLWDYFSHKSKLREKSK
ncbi:MAG: ArsR family transcriptional regulator, partial [Candidatus Hodarchaeales archaeon]